MRLPAALLGSSLCAALAALPHDAPDCAALAQPPDSIVRPPLHSAPTYWSMASLGFRGSVTAAADPASTVPTPSWTVHSLG